MVAYINSETEFQAKTQEARREAKSIQNELRDESRFSDVTVMGVYECRSLLFGIHGLRSVGISFFGTVDSSDVSDLKSKIEEKKLLYPVSWCISVTTNRPL